MNPDLFSLQQKLTWLINGHGRTGIPFEWWSKITPEWIVKNYNVEWSYFKQKNYVR